MRIDLHCHTKTTKKGETCHRNVTPEDFKKYILDSRVKMVGITNHNEFDREHYNKLQNIANNEFLVFPGIELDVVGLDNERGHVVIVYDDKDIDTFENEVNKILKDSTPDDFVIKIDDLIVFLNTINCIVMVHYCKPDQLNKKSIDKIRDNITENYRFFYEPSSYRTLGIMINNNLRALKGTDILDWNDYSTQEFANIKLDIDSYKNLLLFMKKDSTIIESLLNKQNKYSIDISYKSDTKEVVDFYDNINVFFGTKGTGKSVSLDKIQAYFIRLGKNVSYYSPDTAKEKIDEKLKIVSYEKDLSTYGKSNKADLFSYIANWTYAEITQFIDYFNYVKFKGNNRNKEKMKILKINYKIDYNEKIMDTIRQDYKNATEINNILSKIKVSDYLTDKEIARFNNDVNLLLFRVIEKYANEFSETKGVELTNKCIKFIKQVVEKNTETKTVPSGTGFKDYAKSLFKLENKINGILEEFNFSFESPEEYVGKLEENKILYKKIILKMLNNSSKAEDGFAQIKKIKELKKSLIDIKNNIYTDKLVDYITEYRKQYNNFENLSLNDFVGVIKKFILNGNDYTPSTGESTMIILDEILQSNYDVYILDEPEKSLGNNYISDVLVPRLNDLAKLKKVIVIATHNANIAVRTFPYCSVLKTYFNNNYSTYVGNPYTDKLLNIKDTTDVKSWKAESISILEGGRDAFNERSDIYE